MRSIGKLSHERHGVGSIIGAVFILLILVTGFSFYFLNVNTTEEYTRTVQDMQQLDLERNQESITFTSISVTSNGKLNVTVTNTGPSDVHLIWLGVFNELASPNTQQYQGLDIHIKQGETVTNIGSNTTIPVGQRNIQLVTELGNVFYHILVRNTPAFVGYSSNYGSAGLNSPKTRTWDGAWSSATEMPTAGSPVRFVRTACSPLSSRYYEKIIVTLSDDGYLDAYVWTGNSWSVTTNIGYVGTTANAYRAFDIAYEKTSGRAMLVYGISSTDPAKDLAYRIWNGAGWSSEAYINDDGHTDDIQVQWVELATNPRSGSNEIGLLYTDKTHSDVDAFIWNGNNWGNRYELTGTVSTNSAECLALGYEQVSGNLMVAAGEGSLIRWNRWTGTAWGTSATFDINTGSTSAMDWLSLKSDPQSNMLILVSVDGASYLCTALWNGSNWVVDSPHDASVDTNAQRCADVEWEPTGSIALLVWGTSSGSLLYKTWTSAGGWSDASAMIAAGTHLWVQLRRNSNNVPGDVKILGAVMNSDGYLGALKWDGYVLTNLGDAIFTAGTGSTNYECFEIAFQGSN